MIPYIYSAYDLPEDPGITCEDPSLTQQHFQDECDLNLIMARAADTGELPPGRPTFYGDFSDVSDYQSMLGKIQKAQSEFQNLPANIRDFFRNDPSLMLDFIHNPDNLEQCRTLGIFEPLVPEAGSPAPVQTAADQPAAGPPTAGPPTPEKS